MGSKPVQATNQDPVSKIYIQVPRGVSCFENSLAGPSHPRCRCFCLTDCLCLPSFHRDDSAEVDVYSPSKNEWDKIPSMNQVNVQACQRL